MKCATCIAIFQVESTTSELPMLFFQRRIPPMFRHKTKQSSDPWITWQSYRRFDLSLSVVRVPAAHASIWDIMCIDASNAFQPNFEGSRLYSFCVNKTRERYPILVVQECVWFNIVIWWDDDVDVSEDKIVSVLRLLYWQPRIFRAWWVWRALWIWWSRNWWLGMPASWPRCSHRAEDGLASQNSDSASKWWSCFARTHPTRKFTLNLDWIYAKFPINPNSCCQLNQVCLAVKFECYSSPNFRQFNSSIANRPQLFVCRDFFLIPVHGLRYDKF